MERQQVVSRIRFSMILNDPNPDFKERLYSTLISQKQYKIET